MPIPPNEIMKAQYFIPIVLLSLLSHSAAADFAEVSFETSDGGTIYANLYGEGEHAVALGHGAVFNKESWHSLALAMKEQGLQVLAIDFRGYGKSEKGRKSNAAKHLDLLAGIAYLKEKGAERVSMLGGSMGGGAAAQAAVEAETGDIDRLILLAHVPVNAPKKLTGNKLFIVSKGDRLAESVKSQYKKAPEPKRLEILDGDAHAQHIFKTRHGIVLKKLILEFLTE